MKINELPTPCYVIDENIIEENCKVLADVMKKTGCHVLLAQKAFSNYALYPLIGKYLSGTTASGLYEARLGREEMGRENHVFAPAYKDEDMDELVKIYHGNFKLKNKTSWHMWWWQGKVIPFLLGVDKDGNV